MITIEYSYTAVSGVQATARRSVPDARMRLAVLELLHQQWSSELTERAVRSMQEEIHALRAALTEEANRSAAPTAPAVPDPRVADR